jgi:hypothetical protein
MWHMIIKAIRITTIVIITIITIIKNFQIIKLTLLKDKCKDKNLCLHYKV